MNTTQPFGDPCADSFEEGEFGDVVQDDLRGNTKATARLSYRGLLPFWEDELIRLKMELEVQLAERDAKASVFQQECFARRDKAAGKQAWFRHEVEDKKWKASVLRFRYCVETRLRHVKRLVQQDKMSHEQKLGLRLTALEERVTKIEEETEPCT
jgi:hypothetical protein